MMDTSVQWMAVHSAQDGAQVASGAVMELKVLGRHEG